MRSTEPLSFVLFFALVLLDSAVWYQMFSSAPSPYPEFYFLDVGQGDAELIRLPHNIKVLTDAGPDSKILRSMGAVLPSDRYIDIAIISHPQLDHFNGFTALMARYTIGVFLINGRADAPGVGEWDALLAALTERHVPVITVGAGSVIRHGTSRIHFLSPDIEYIQSGELNDTGLVEMVDSPPVRALLTADISANVESYLLDEKTDLRAQILKVPHHGSHYSSSQAFLDAVRPDIAVIEAGTLNRYGHPAAATLDRLAQTRAEIFRTDRDGTIKITTDATALRVFTHQ